MELEFPFKFNALALQFKSEILHNWFNNRERQAYSTHISFPQTLSQLAFTSTEVIHLGECTMYTIPELESIPEWFHFWLGSESESESVFAGIRIKTFDLLRNQNQRFPGIMRHCSYRTSLNSALSYKWDRMKPPQVIRNSCTRWVPGSSGVQIPKSGFANQQWPNFLGSVGCMNFW